MGADESWSTIHGAALRRAVRILAAIDEAHAGWDDKRQVRSAPDVTLGEVRAALRDLRVRL